MIKLVKIQDPSQKWALLSQFQPEKDCWIVSDLKSKQAIQTELLHKKGHLPGFCVLRANEFYKELFLHLNKGWNLVQDAIIRELFLEFASQHPLTWVKNFKNTKSFFEFFHTFLPVLLHPKGLELWNEKHKKNNYLEEFFLLSQQFFVFLSQKNCWPESGIKSFLLNHLPEVTTLPFAKKRLFVDLSFSFDLCEKEIFKEIARSKELLILAPKGQWLEDWLNVLDFKGAIKTYQLLEEELTPKQVTTLKLKNKNPLNITQVESESQTQEIEKAILKIKDWISKGVPLKEITLLAPYIEDYWFAIKMYLEKEGLLFKKSIVAKARDFPDMLYFLSALRVHIGVFGFEDLETFIFYKKPKREFKSFYVDYFCFPKRELSQKLLFKNKILKKDQLLKGFEFINWALSLWPKTGDEFLQQKLIKVLQDFPVFIEFKALSWFKILESCLLNLEIELKSEAKTGISCLSFNALPAVKSPYVFIMGLNEERLKYINILNEREKQEILQDLGFPLALPHPHEAENHLLWFLQSSHLKEVYMSRSCYNFKGAVQSKSLVYFLAEFLLKAKTAKLTGELLWNKRRKQNSVFKILNPKGMEHSTMDHKSIQAIEQAFKNKKQKVKIKNLKLSPTDLKTYSTCPFKYSAQKFFCVQDKKPTELELSPLIKGSLMHKLFELFLKKYPGLTVEEADKDKLIEEIMLKEHEIIYPQQKELIIEALKNLLNLFIKHEQENRDKFPFLKPKAFEVKCKLYWDQKSGELALKGDYPFTGRLDRLDYDSQSRSYVIMDYKSSERDLTNISNWLKEEDLQLTFYAQAFEKGLIKGFSPAPVSALFYLIVKDFSKKGFSDKGSLLADLLQKKSQGQKPKEILQKAITASNKKLQEMVKKMQEGEFYPQPKDKKVCVDCSYQNWCRIKELK